MALKDIKTYKPRDVSLNISSIIDEVEDIGAAFVARRGRVHAIILPTTLQGLLNAVDCYEEFLELELRNATDTLPSEFQTIINNLKRLLKEDLERVRTKQMMFRDAVMQGEMEGDYDDNDVMIRTSTERD